MSAILLLVGILSSIRLEFTAAESIGVCYGVNGGDLPSRQEVVDLYKNSGIGRMRIYYPDEEALQALKGSNIELILDVAKETLPSLADPNAANDWVNKHVKPFSQDVKIKYIAVGNEIQPNDNEAKYILPAMQNIHNAISLANLQDQIKVSTAINSPLIANPYPPNNGVFSNDAYIKPIVDFLVSNGAPLLANVYPYFAYAEPNQQSITLDYALFIKQEKNDVGYQNLFDAMLDSIYAALEKVGASNVRIVVSESGWPSEDGAGATTENAATYYANLINHVKSGNGTPKRPGASIETYLFAMFDENNKSGAESEKHFGLFRPDKSPKYQLSFN